MKKLTWLIIPLFIVVAIQFTISNIRILSAPVWGDFEYFYNTGERALLRQNPYIEEGGGLLRNTPPTLFIYASLTLFPIHSAQIIFFIISFMAFLIGSYFLFKLICQKQNLNLWLIYLIAVLVFFPFRYNFGSGHINALLFSLLSLTFYFLKQKREEIAGFFLSLSIFLSVTPGFLLLPLLIKKRFKALKGTFISMLVVSAVTALFFGLDMFKYYFHSSKQYFDFGISSYYNQSLTAFLIRIFQNVDLTRISLLIILVVALTFYIYVQTKLENTREQNLIGWSISILYILIFPPFAWQYHFITVIFCLIVTLFVGLKMKLGYKFFLLLFLCYTLIGWNIKNPGIFDQNIFGPIILSHVLIGTIILLTINFYQLKRLLR